MSLILYSPVRYDLIQRLFSTVLNNSLGTNITDVVWGANNASRPVRPYAAFNYINLPSQIGQAQEKEADIHNSKYQVDIDTLVVGDVVKVRVNGVPLSHTVTGVDTLDTVRDALVDLVNDDLEPASAVADGVTGRMFVEDTIPGGIFSLFTNEYGSSSVAGDSVERCVMTYIDRQPALISLQIYSQDARQSVVGNLLSTALLAFNLQSTLDLFYDHNMSFRILTPATNVGAISIGGALQQGQSNVDIEVIATSMYAEPTDVIESVEATVLVSGDTIPIEVP